MSISFDCLRDAAELRQAPSVAGAPSPDAQAIMLHQPDEHWVMEQNGVAAARASLWVEQAPLLPGHRVGVIGHAAFGDGESARAMLNHAAKRLAELKCTLAVGPMDGNTWRRYRLITERGGEPAFFLEPDNPDNWPDHFVASGFVPLAGYSSALVTNLHYQDRRSASIARRLGALGVTTRPMDMARASDDLRRVYEVCAVSFRRNFLYAPLPEAEFSRQYHEILPAVRPELVWLAEEGDTPVGFVFGLPDLLQARRGQPIDTCIVKTIAVVPGRRYAGLGVLLADICTRSARDCGYTRAIHALMHDSNVSRNISDRCATTMRRYTLYARPLHP